jgi:23S rRNA (pseudouridine1915-N3)-methyltransferase
MKITLLLIGKTAYNYISEGFKIYESRLKHYILFDTIYIPDIKNTKNLSFEQQKDKEAELLIKNIAGKDLIVLLDEKGSEYSSIDFAKYMQKTMNKGFKNILFVIGGPYGFADTIYKLNLPKLSLSKMTFSHQMIRLIFIEQLYRAMTIIKNEPYHHQ